MEILPMNQKVLMMSLTAFLDNTSASAESDLDALKKQMGM